MTHTITPEKLRAWASSLRHPKLVADLDAAADAWERALALAEAYRLSLEAGYRWTVMPTSPSDQDKARILEALINFDKLQGSRKP